MVKHPASAFTAGKRGQPWLAVLLLLSALSVPSTAREWRDASSGRSLEGELLGIEQGKAVVISSKQRYRLGLENLSEADREFLKGWAMNKTAAQMLPPPVWPAAVTQGEIHMRGGPQADGSFKFHCRHYEFHADAEVSASVMNDFAMVAEGTIRFLYSLPISYPPLEGKKFYARILSNMESYEKAGGPGGSAGVFVSASLRGEGVLLVPFQSLGIEHFLGRNTKGRDYDARVLVHEIAHQVTAELLPLMPRWLSEGIAEYAATMPYRNGVFQLGERERILALRQRLEYYQQFSRTLGVNAGARWVLNPSQLVSMNDEAWMTSTRTQQGQLMLHKLYLSSLFLTHYFLHYADQGEAQRIRLYFHSLNDAARYIHSGGEHGSMPGSLESRRGLTLDDMRSLFVRDLFTPEMLAAVDREFNVTFATLGFRL